MAYEINELKRILTLVLFAMPMIASININCSGRAFHCVNSTHFMICVDLGDGLSTTIDDFVIPCPAATVCHEKNMYECDFPEIEVTTPPLQVINIYKQSDTSETTSVINSVTTSMPTSEILRVFKENTADTTLPISKEVMPGPKLEVLKDIQSLIRGNTENTTEINIPTIPNFINISREINNDKQTNNNKIITSATDNNNNLEPAVKFSIQKAANASLTDKTKSIDTVSSVIELINLYTSKPSSDILDSLDTINDNIASTTKQYSNKQVKIQGEILENVTDKVIIPTEIIFGETPITDEVSTIPVINTFMEKEINYSIEYFNKTDSNNQTTTKRIYLDKTNGKTELVPETTIEYLAPVIIYNISEPVIVVSSNQTTTDKTFNPLTQVDLKSVVSNNEKVPSTKPSSNYVTNLNDDTVTTINQHTTIKNNTLSNNTVTTGVISTNPILYTNIQNVNEADTNNDDYPDSNSTVEIKTTDKEPKTNTNYFTLKPMTVASLPTTTEQGIVPITKETNIIYTTEKNPTSADLIGSNSLVEKDTIVNQPSEIIMTTDSPIKITNNLYKTTREFTETHNTERETKNTTADNMNTTESFETVVDVSTKDTINIKRTDPTLLPPTTIEYPAIELSTSRATYNEFTVHATEVTSDLPQVKVSGSDNEPYTNVENSTILYLTTNSTANITKNIKTVFNTMSTDIIYYNGMESIIFPLTTIKYPAIEISSIETGQNEFTASPIEATSDLPATNATFNVYEPQTDNIGTNTFLRDLTTPTFYSLTSAPVTNTIVKDLTSQSDIVTNPKIGFTPDIIEPKEPDGYTSKYQATTQKLTIYPETIIPDSLNQPENSGTDSRLKNLNADLSTTTVTTTTYLNSIENSVTTPFPSSVTQSSILSDTSPSVISATNDVNFSDILQKTTIPPSNYYANKITSMPKTVTTSINMDTEAFQEVSTNTPQLVNIYRVPKYKIKSSTTFPVDYVPIKVLPLIKLPKEKIGKVNQLNTISSTTDTINDWVSFTVRTGSVNTESIIYDIDANANLNKAETVNPIIGKEYDTSPSPADHNIKDENIKIVSVFDVIKSLVSAMPTQHSNHTLTSTQDSSPYVPAPNNIPYYNLVPVDESVTQNITEATVSFADTKVKQVAGNSVLATPSSQTLLTTEKSTENFKYVGNEASVPSTLILKNLNPTKSPVNYVAQKTNDNILLRKQIPTQSNKVYKVEADSYSSLVSSFTPDMVVSRDGLVASGNDKMSTITDSAFMTSWTQMPPKVVVDDIKKISTEYPLSTSEVIKTETDNYNTEPWLPISSVSVEQVIMTTEPTYTTNVVSNLNQDVMFEIKPKDLPHKESIVNNNTPQSMPALQIPKVTAGPFTSKPTSTTNTFARTTPSLAMIGKTNQDIPGIKPTSLPQYVMSTVNNKSPQLTSVRTTKSVIGSLSVPDSMVETIKVVGDVVTGTYLDSTIFSAVISNNPTVHLNYSIKSVNNNIIDHESMVIGNTSKNNFQNTTTYTNLVNTNKAEIINHTESDWMRPDVNIDEVLIKESSTEVVGTSTTSVMNSDVDSQNKTFPSDSSIITQISPIDDDDSKMSAVPSSPLPVTETESVSTVNENIETFDVKKSIARVDSKNLTESYNLNNTTSDIVIIILTHKNRTTNDELKQHLTSTNHTMTAEIQSHLNGSDKQSNKPNDGQTFKVTGTYNPNLAPIKLNAGSENKSAFTISNSVFNCSNHTRGKYADKKDCRKFYTCIGNLQPILGICPNNTVFSEINKQCTKNLSHCVRNNQFRCLLEGRFSDFFKDDIYYICVKNRMHGFTRYTLKCQNDYHLNKDSVRCKKNEDISSQSASSLSETSTDESKPETKTEKNVITDNFECEKEGNFPYIKGCSKYYVCTKTKNGYRRMIKECASDEVFDNKKKKCVESDSGECSLC